MLGGKIMDNFMDKLAQKWNAAEMIKANSAAEAMELKRLRDQLAEYESILQEMRKLNLKNSELTDSSKQLIEKGINELTVLLEQQKQLPDQDLKQLIDQLQSTIQEYIHTENVKVYRNVQAVVVDGLKDQNESYTKQLDLLKDQATELKQKNDTLLKKIKGIKPLLIIVMIAILANLGMTVAWILGIL